MKKTFEKVDIFQMILADPFAAGYGMPKTLLWKFAAGPSAVVST